VEAPKWKMKDFWVLGSEKAGKSGFEGLGLKGQIVKA
jgi:hypothetical protein